MRPRLTALAPSVVEVVRYAGGWLFDRAMAGWDVTVITSDHSDSRPLRILGASVRDLETTLAVPVLGTCLSTIAVRSDLYDCDARVRRMVLATFDEGLAEVRFWGDPRPEDLDGTADPVWHRLSFAARAFKAQALAAAAAEAADPNEDIEVYGKLADLRAEEVRVTGAPAWRSYAPPGTGGRNPRPAPAASQAPAR
jgi:hypothetical protein